MIGWWIVAVLCIILFLNIWYSYRQQRTRRPRPGRRPTPPANAAAPHVRGRDLRSPRRRLTVRIREEVRSRGRTGGLVLFLIVLIALLLSLQLLGWLGRSTEYPNLVVALAPFSAPDGGVAPEGASVQQAIITEWSQGNKHRLSRPLQLVALNDPLPDAQAALAIAQSEHTDVVIWGSVEQGGVADDESLRPLLLWWPRQPPPHARAFGLQERVVLPVVYDLATSPLNGQAVLREILDMLDLYQTGDYDGAIQAINTLLNSYAVGYAVDGRLRPDLLLGVRGAIASMQQQWAKAEGDFRAAIAATQPGRPEYWNNLGVALLAQGRTDDAIQAFNTSQNLLAADGFDLAAVHLNSGLLLLAGPDPAAALPALTRARDLAPRSVVTLVALAEAQTRANQFGPAVDSINLAAELAPGDPLVALGLSRVQLAQLVGLGDQPAWEMEIAPPLPQELLTQMRTRLDEAVANLETLATTQRSQATSNDAAGRPETGRVHEGAALQQGALLEQVRYWRAVLLTEEGIAAQANPRGWLSRSWQALFGDDPPLEQAQQTLQPLVRSNENNYDLRVQLARVDRLLGLPKPALEHYTRATELAANRPEAWYGVAITKWQSEADGDERNQAIRDALSRSISADSRYTPAYLLCARLEIRQKQWQAALPCLEWLHANRPDQTAAHVALGQVQRELGQLAEAELTLLPLANANNGLALVELGRVYQAAGQPEAAETVFRRALEVDGGNAVAAYELGRLLEARGDYGGAELSYAQAIAANDSYMEAHLALGKLYAVHLNQPERAVQEYGRAIEGGGRDARTYEDLGREFLEMGQYKEAANALEESVRLNPNVPESRHALAQAYLELGRFDAAREQERAAIARKADGIYLDAQIGIAESFRRQGQHDEAIAAYNAALDADPDALTAYVGLGRTAADKGDLQAAIGYYNQALARKPDDIDAHIDTHFWLGQALIEQDQFSAALKEFEIVLDRDPNNAIAYYGSGRAYSRIAEGMYGVDDAEAAQYDALARERLDKALSLRPNLAEAWLERGIINERQSQLNAALSDYAQAAQFNQRDAEAPFLQGKLYLSLNNVAAATEALESSVSRDPRSADTQYWLGRAYRAQNRMTEAIRQFQRAVEINGAYNEARYFQGLTEEDTSQVEAARTTYQAIVAQAPPDDRWRQQAEERLRELGQ
jgi:tetratricopeptide (TPR) repeat protein